jgi:hypothetical protein
MLDASPGPAIENECLLQVVGVERCPACRAHRSALRCETNLLSPLASRSDDSPIPPDDSGRPMPLPPRPRLVARKRVHAKLRAGESGDSRLTRKSVFLR